MRPLSIAAAGIAALIVLTGCNNGEDSGSAPAPRRPSGTAPTSVGDASFDIETALDGADPDPYSARITMETLVAGVVAVELTGRMNFNGPANTGRLEISSVGGSPGEEGLNGEMIMLEDSGYMRARNQNGTYGPWLSAELPAATPGMTDFRRYARLLLDIGPMARKGTEEVDGTTAYRLSGTLGREEIRTVDRRLYDRMRAADLREFTCDLWIDESGRAVRFEQWLKASGNEAHNVMTIGQFRDPIPVSAPE